MSQPFLITGLPRSRTAWFSVVADMMPGTVCHHEPTKEFRRWQDIGAFWATGKTRYVGAADSMLGLHLGDLLDQYKPRTAILKRPLEAVRASLERIGIPAAVGMLELLSARLEPFLGHPLVRVVPFEGLNDGAVVYRALRHLMPDAVIDPGKIRRMMGMNVQASPALALTVAKARMADVADLVGQDVLDELELA